MNLNLLLIMQSSVNKFQCVNLTPTKPSSIKTEPCESASNYSCIQSALESYDTVGSLKIYGNVLQCEVQETPAAKISCESKSSNLNSVSESTVKYDSDSNLNDKESWFLTESTITISAEDIMEIAKLDDTAHFFAAIHYEKHEIISWEEKLDNLIASFIVDFVVDFDAVHSLNDK